ncbi:MAG: endonuclease V [Candidatus Altarchaeaceae archaeon]
MEINLYDYVFNLVKQIPKGKISTYKEIAIALGDEISARAVGRILNCNENLNEIPCYRIINSNGEIGGYKLGIEKKIDLLKKDGFEIENNRIKNFEKYVFKEFKTDFPLKKLRNLQEEMKRKIIIEDFYNFEKFCGVDVSYYGKCLNEKGIACLVFNENKNFSKIFSERKINFPYIPTYLFFREFPVIKEVIEKAIREGIIEKEKTVILVDGNGILHPLNMGIASHIGVVMDIATIGVSKKLLCGKIKDNEIYLNGKKIGVKIKNIYVSPGHKISLETSVKIVKKFLKFKIPEQLRLAHIFANEKRNEINRKNKKIEI